MVSIKGNFRLGFEVPKQWMYNLFWQNSYWFMSSIARIDGNGWAGRLEQGIQISGPISGAFNGNARPEVGRGDHFDVMSQDCSPRLEENLSEKIGSRRKERPNNLTVQAWSWAVMLNLMTCRSQCMRYAWEGLNFSVKPPWLSSFYSARIEQKVSEVVGWCVCVVLCIFAN